MNKRRHYRLKLKIAVIVLSTLILSIALDGCSTGLPVIKPSEGNAAASESDLSDSDNEAELNDADGTVTEPGAEEGDQLPSDSSFEISFLDVGQGDASLVSCDGHTMLVDAGGSDDSRFIYTYLQDHGINYLDIVVCTHAHEDHAGGLAAALSYARIGAAYAPVADYDNEYFKDYVRYVKRRGNELIIPKAGDSWELGSALVQVLGPVNTETEDHNDMSIVLRILYGSTSFLIMGDATSIEESDVVRFCTEEGHGIRSTVLRLGHHGSGSSTSEEFMDTVDPDYAVISVGEDNSYMFPDVRVLNLIKDRGIPLYRTDLNGSITCTSDGMNVSFATEREAADEFTVAAGSGITADHYVINKSSGKFHLPDCDSINKMSPGNKEISESDRDTLIEQGYSPCGMCRP